MLDLLFETAKQLADETCDLERDLSALTQRMADLIENANKIIIGATRLGLVVSLNIKGEQVVSGCFGHGEGIKNAVKEITETVKEQVK